MQPQGEYSFTDSGSTEGKEEMGESRRPNFNKDFECGGPLLKFDIVERGRGTQEFEDKELRRRISRSPECDSEDSEEELFVESREEEEVLSMFVEGWGEEEDIEAETEEINIEERKDWAGWVACDRLSWKVV